MEETLLQFYIRLAKTGTRDSVDEIMRHLNKSISIGESKFIDYALGLVETVAGIASMEHYLFHGTQMQRNYCALYFGRLGEYSIVRKAFELGLVDEKQAFSR